MAYGTESGVIISLTDFPDLGMNYFLINEPVVAEFRGYADGIIDARLAAVVHMGDLPLAEPSAVINAVSDDLTTYLVLRRVFTGNEPTDCGWIDKFYTRPLGLLELEVAAIYDRQN